MTKTEMHLLRKDHKETCPNIVVTLGRQDYRYFFDLPSKILIMCIYYLYDKKKSLRLLKNTSEEQA